MVSVIRAFLITLSTVILTFDSASYPRLVFKSVSGVAGGMNQLHSVVR